MLIIIIYSQIDNVCATFVIPSARPFDAGTYTVKAVNSAGETLTSCEVCIADPTPPPRPPPPVVDAAFDSDIQSDIELMKPFVQLPLKDVCVFEGKPIRLDCIIVGQPEPEVIWYHENVPVKESEDVQLLFQGDLCSLIIKEVFMEDIGEYKVIAINVAGEASSKCTLTATPLKTELPVISDVKQLIDEQVAPKFDKLLTDIYAVEGEKIEMECSVIGQPKPSVKWYLNNKEIMQNERIQSSFNETDGLCKLTIHSVSNTDRGVYMVKAKNPYAEAKCLCNLNVKSINPIEKQREIDENLICPSFKELFTDIVAQIDETVTFKCLITGQPKPSIKWHFNDLPIDESKMQPSTIGDHQLLTIHHVSTDTIGKISCIAENVIGKATCVGYLTLIGDFNAPSAEQSQRYFEVHNNKSSNITIKKQMFTTTHTSQVNSYENGSNLTQTHIHGLNPVSSNNVDSKSVEEYHQINTSQPAIYQKSIVNFTKPNPDGESEISKIVKPHRKTMAPRFVSPFVGRIVDQGDAVTLEGIIDGYPSPDIEIMKNGEKLFATDRLSITRHLNKVIIQMNNVDVNDAGRYSCVAKNDGGTSTSTADVVVKSKII